MQYLDKKVLKRNTKYRLSFFMRLENVQTETYLDLRYCNKGPGSVYYPFKQHLRGTIPWTRFAFEFKSPDAVIGELAPPFIRFNFNDKKGNGKVWIDHVEMVEIP